MKRLRGTDFKKIQKSLKQKTDKQIQTLTNLLQVPDYDITQFFQTLMKNQNYQQILWAIPQQKKIDFFSKNYQSFLQTQQQLLKMQIPQLSNIPKAREFHLKPQQTIMSQQNSCQASVIQIIDSFSSHVLEKNLQQAMRIYKMIKEMKQHQKYKQYFYQYHLNAIFRNAYNGLIDHCQDLNILIKLGESIQAVQLYFKQRQTQIFAKINSQLRIDASVYSLRKTLSYLLNQIYDTSKEFKVKFRQFLQEQNQLSSYLSKWIQTMSRSYYQSVQGFIYQHQQISEILKNLGQILQTSTQLQQKGLSLHRELSKQISLDLPIHLQKIIEVILESFDDILKYNNQLFQFVQFKSLNAVNDLINQLKPITIKDYGKKCASQKGILLINSFLMILFPLCQQKWAFLHQNILETIVDKVQATLDSDKIKLPLWDYYHLFLFFYQLGQGKVRNRTLFDPVSNSYRKQKINKIKKFGQDCRIIFQEMLICQYCKEVLYQIPQLLWQFKKYAQIYDKPALKPTTLSIDLIFRLQNFLKQIEFRISKQHYQYLGIQFYQYLVYVIEYVLYWSYHDRLKNQRVFTLHKKQEKLFNKAKQFNLDQTNFIKANKILKLSNFTKNGLQRFCVDMYFVTDVFQILINKCEKIKADDFLYKISKVLASKQLKNQPLDTNRNQYNELLKQFVNVYQKQPQIMKKYLNQKRLGSSNNSVSTIQKSSSRLS